jgi:hypothetical protein
MLFNIMNHRIWVLKFVFSNHKNLSGSSKVLNRSSIPGICTGLIGNLKLELIILNFYAFNFTLANQLHRS